MIRSDKICRWKCFWSWKCLTNGYLENVFIENNKGCSFTSKPRRILIIKFSLTHTHMHTYIHTLEKYIFTNIRIYRCLIMNIWMNNLIKYFEWNESLFETNMEEDIFYQYLITGEIKLNDFSDDFDLYINWKSWVKCKYAFASI